MIDNVVVFSAGKFLCWHGFLIDLILQHKQLTGKLVGVFITHESPFVNDVPLDLQLC